MSGSFVTDTIGADTITDRAGTGKPNFSQGIRSASYYDAAGTGAASFPEGMIGRTDGASPAVGEIGEKMESLIGSTTLPSSTNFFDPTSLVLTKGVWLLVGHFRLDVGTGGAVNFDANPIIVAAFGTTSGNNAPDLPNGVEFLNTYLDAVFNTTYYGAISTSSTIIHTVTTATQTVYLKSRGTSYVAGTPTYFARFQAARIA